MSRAPDIELLDLDRALQALAAVDDRKARVVELRYLGGMTVEETADALAVSTETIRRDWRLAKLRLLDELDGEPRRGGSEDPPLQA